MSSITKVAVGALALSTATAIKLDSPKEADANRERIVREVNSDPESPWRADVSQRFAGTPYSFLKKMAGIDTAIPPRSDFPTKTLADMHRAFGARPIPEAFDARVQWSQCQPLIGEIRDQGACGSCYAVSSASALSDRFCIAHNGTMQDRLAGADLMDCCKTCAGANGGCYGGSTSHCMDYVTSQGIATGGRYLDNSLCLAYPFPPCDHHDNGTHGACPDVPYNSPTCWWACDSNTTSPVTYDQSQAAHKFALGYNVDKTMEAIQTDIMNNGPSIAAMYLVDSFEVYKSGVFSTNSSDYIGMHAVKIVGWGVDPVPYWKVVNSWNTEWGEEGTFRIDRRVNTLAIMDQVVGATMAAW